jgi:hypothetical protein
MGHALSINKKKHTLWQVKLVIFFLFSVQASDFSDVDDWPTLGYNEVCTHVTFLLLTCQQYMNR